MILEIHLKEQFMKNMHLLPADILLPKKNFESWSVIACDQYTSEPEYWEGVKKAAGDNPSALNIILPEAHLSKDNSAKIANINKTMQEYIDGGVFDLYENTVVYIERTLKDGNVRRGVLGLIDLEDYSYLPGATTGIRATEQTVLERIPPRVQIRKDAPLEMPHVLLFIDDAKNTVFELLDGNKATYKKLYDFTLMQNAGSIKGFAVSEEDVNALQDKLDALKNASANGLLFAVGDGNHSLATAKECYNQGNGPRYALVEVMNIHDTSLEFEPIYRVLFNVEPEKVINDFVAALGGEYNGDDAQKFTCVYGNTEKEISVKPCAKLPVATLQTWLDKYIKENSEIKIDYIHGVSSLKTLASKKNALGFLFEGMEKADLFPAVVADGSLPRKTFSAGCADDKRFYLEARKIK